jgi:tRNA pseudouridine32 synthase/23S rRNA pseudouridine746 synthase
VVPISKNKPPISVVAPVPEHMREKLTLCGWREEAAPVIASEAKQSRSGMHT